MYRIKNKTVMTRNKLWPSHDLQQDAFEKTCFVGDRIASIPGIRAISGSQSSYSQQDKCAV